uniref:Uncharacterized protein n=1 Tax=Desertifilum tharense IPPAS B-1220 TaxID=1781255 RepID=A0ACD5H389_9CYAN
MAPGGWNEGIDNENLLVISAPTPKRWEPLELYRATIADPVPVRLMICKMTPGINPIPRSR